MSSGDAVWGAVRNVVVNGLFYVAVGGALGASSRYLLGQTSARVFGSAFPYGTLITNVMGSFLMGILVAWLALKLSGGESLRLFVGVGLLGGFTTFSAFSLEAISMFERKAYGLLTAYVGSSVALSLLALFVGLILARKVFAL